MDLIITLVSGGVVGWLGSILMKTNAQMGLIANVVVGIVGAWLGGFLAGKMGIGAEGDISRWLISIGGAMVLILILKVLKVFK